MIEMNPIHYKRSKTALREALRNDVSFCWFSPIERTVVRHTSAIVEAMAYRREFSFLNSPINFN
jgi:hypothetical protein